MTYRIGFVILRLGHEGRWFRPSLVPEIHDAPGVLSAHIRTVRWCRGSPQVWS